MGRPSGTVRYANELSGFGFPEPPTAVEACTIGNCSRNNEPLVTDLYCHDHGRFLPFIGVLVGVRAFVAIVASLLIYGAFELTAQTGSRTPVYAVCSVLFLCFAVIPLRHFTRTASAAALIWLFGSLTPVISRVTPSHFHVIAAAVIVVGATPLFAGYAIADASSFARSRPLDRDHEEIAWVVATALIVAVWCAFAGLLVRYSAYVLPGAESGVSTAMLYIALSFVAVAALIISVSGGVLGAGRFQTQVPQIANPSRPTWISPTTRSPGTRAYQAQNALDIMIETFTWVMYLMMVAVGNALAIAGRVTAHCIALVGYALARAVIAVTNFVIRLTVLTARWARAAIVAVARLAWYAVIVACHGMANSIISVLVPVGALLGTPWLVLAMAGQSRQYLRHGSVEALGFMTILLLAVSALLLGTWVILANQHPRESFRSAGRSIPITAGYGFVALLFGGLLLATLGQFGYGRIRFGLVTYLLVGVAIIAVVMRRLGRRTGPSASQPVPGPLAHNGRQWSVAVALAMIAGTVIGLALFPSWAATPAARPTQLATAARTATSVTISWAPPLSGPRPTRYIIELGQAPIGSVPGTVTIYRAADLAPGTGYTFQVIALQGSRQSQASTAITVRTSTPPVWDAALTRQWIVHYSKITTQNFSFNGNGLTTDTWTFTPRCATFQCPVALAGAIVGSTFTATMRQSDKMYTSTSTDTTYAECGSTPVASTLMLKIRILGATVTKGRWTATSWSGSMILSIPSSTNCGASTIAASISAG